MKVVVVLVFLFSGISFASALPPGFDLAKYQALSTKAAEKGELLEAPDGLSYKILSRIDPADTSKPHDAEYFSVLGANDSQGRFSIVEISMVSEDWRKRSNGDWEIEQWLWSAATDGILQSVGHYLLVETAEGSVLDDKALPVGKPDDPAELSRWETKLEEWYRLP